MVENNGSSNDEDDWAPETIEQSEKLSSQIGKLVIDKDTEKSLDERLDMLYQFFIKAKENDSIQVN